MKGAERNAVAKRKGPGSRHQPEQTRAAILDAALAEFAEHGMMGARTDAIATQAGVNKALLYYYFKDKETLYGAVLDHVFSGLSHIISAALEKPGTPSEKLLAYVGAHYDYVAKAPLYPRLVQREMMRSGRNLSPHLRRITDQYFRPALEQLREVFRRGIAQGEFRETADPSHAIPAILGLIVFYFSNTPLTELVAGHDPLTPDRVAEHRRFVLDFVASAIFARPHRAARNAHP